MNPFARTGSTTARSAAVFLLLFAGALPVLGADGGAETNFTNPIAVPLGSLSAMVTVETWIGGCSGTVIAPDTVLTAGHCFCTDNTVGGNVCDTSAYVTFRRDPLVPSLEPRALTGTATIHPGYNPSWVETQIEHDFAIVKLNGVSPAFVDPFYVSRGYPAVGSYVTSAGFGHIGPDCGVFNFTDLYKSYDAVDGYEDGHDIMRFKGETACHGDSGGPVLDIAERWQFAVHSAFAPSWFGDGSTKADTTGSVFNWIKSFMCRSSKANSCTGQGYVCGCTASNNILWRHTSGEARIWYMDGATVANQATPGGVDQSWQIQGTGDFDADGRGDILWRNVNGQVVIWHLNADGSVAWDPWIGGTDPYHAWSIQGVGDFNGDGRSDVLWRDYSGQLAIWFEGDINDSAWPGYYNVPAPVELVFQIQGVGDFNGDGKSDILWRDTRNGAVHIWLMDGGTRIGHLQPGGIDSSWTVQAVGDFDGNLRSDILWRDSLGRLLTWFNGEAANARSPSFRNTGATADWSWRIVGVGDFDFDDRDDILWRGTDGAAVIWLMNGAHVVADIYPQEFAGNDWTVAGLLHNSKK